jgi:methyltransferase
MNMFGVIFMILILQRLGELLIARSNEKWMKERGGVEYGQNHYKWMVAMHAAFFLVLLMEGWSMGFELNPYWIPLFVLFLGVQCGRVWAIVSLGRYWNTKIIVCRGAHVVAKGPYRFFKHPNYLIVTLELILIPLLFNAYLTMVLFTLLNQWMLSVRIPEEERALRNETDYRDKHGRTRGYPVFRKNSDSY